MYVSLLSRRSAFCTIVLLWPALLVPDGGMVGRAADVEAQLAAIAAAGPNGQGAQAASYAADMLSKCDAAILPRLLEAMDGDNPVAANFLRQAYERIVARELARANPTFNLEALRAYVVDTRHNGKARRLALDLVARLDPEFAPRFLAQALDDPEFRFQAVALALERAAASREAGNRQQERQELLVAFQHARAAEQVLRASRELAALGEEADPVRHLGFIVDWYVVGPFAAPGYSGFDTAFGPEQQPFAAEVVFADVDGSRRTWQHHRCTDPLGLVNLVEVFGPLREQVAYAYAEVESEQQQAAELRCGADDNLTVWLNGEQVFARRQWLNGIRLDRFIVPVQLVAGRNQLLVKVCQGPQHRDPEVPNNWSMQVRLCTPDGLGLKLKTIMP
jgi:hypothetical protein